MNVGTAHSEVNPNTRVMNSRGIWLSYVLGIGLLHVVLLSIPFFSVPVVWTLTNIIHNLVRERHGGACSSEQSAEIPVETIPLCFQRCRVSCSTSALGLYWCLWVMDLNPARVQVRQQHLVRLLRGGVDSFPVGQILHCVPFPKESVTDPVTGVGRT